MYTRDVGVGGAVVAMQVGWVEWSHTMKQQKTMALHSPPKRSGGLGPPRVAAYHTARVDMLGGLPGVGSTR